MNNPVVHFEIGCRDKAVTEQFYAKLFDWKMAAMGPATMIDTGGAGIGGHITSLGHEPHHYTTFYVMVDDLQAALDKAQEQKIYWRLLNMNGKQIRNVVGWRHLMPLWLLMLALLGPCIVRAQQFEGAILG